VIDLPEPPTADGSVPVRTRGAVSAVRRHYDQAADALSLADPDRIARLIIRRLSPEEWPAALEKQAGDIEVVVDMTASA
jgi:glucose 1-dehydrogenase